MSYTTSGPVEVILEKVDTVDPAVGNDNTQGYAIKSRWINTSSNEEWVCTDASTGAASWELTTGGDGDVLSDGTTAQDAVLLTERADHVNTPAVGFAEIWLDNSTDPPRFMFTDEVALDTAVLHVETTEPNGNNIVKWDGASGKVKNCADMGYSGGKLDISGTTASLQIKERNTGPTGTANNGLIWIRDDAVQTLMFTDDADVDKPIVTGPASATDNAIVRFDGATGNIVQQATNLFYTDAGQIQLNAASAAVRMKERTSGPTGSASQGLFWVKDDVPTAPMFTDDTDVVHRLNKELDITLASNELIDVDATEVVIGGGYLDGSTGGTFSWEILGTYNDNGGTGNQDLDVFLYDRGPDGTPVAGVLRSTISIDSLDTLDRVSQALTVAASPGTDTDEIDSDEPRLYEVRAKLDAGGGVDTAKILSVRFIES
jgi:hypothetical protein